jgi:hypothetical protein
LKLLWILIWWLIKNIDGVQVVIHYKKLCPLQPINQWLNVLNNYIINYSHWILFQILWEKNCSHILVVHLISKWWHDNKKNDIIFSLQVFIHMASMIDDKVTWMSKISYENVTRIKSFKIWLKNDYTNDMDKIMCHCIDNVIIQLFYNDSKMIINNLIWV